MIQHALAKYLQSRKAIRNLIGERGVFRGRIPQNYTGQLAIVLSKNSDEPYSIIEGESDSREQSIQVDCVALRESSGYSAERLYESVRDALSGYRGEWSGIYVHSCMRVNGVDFAVPPQDGSDVWGYQYTADYNVIYDGTAPTLT